MGLVYGVGINDVEYVVQVKETIERMDGRLKQKLVWMCPDYEDWKSMLERCFSARWKQKYPTYKDVSCTEDWTYLSKFKEWKSLQRDAAGKHLDKDIIIPGNKLYSPETRAYVNPMTNLFVGINKVSKGEWPVGVCWYKKYEKFRASCSNPFTKKVEHLGYFNDEQEAHEVWRQRKHELAQLVAETESDPRVVEALKSRYSVEEWCKTEVEFLKENEQ